VSAIAKSWTTGLTVSLIWTASWFWTQTIQARIPEMCLSIKVLVFNHAAFSPETLAKAEEQANQIFRPVDVEIIWVNHASLPEKLGLDGLKHIGVVLKLLPKPRATLSSQSALGEALPCRLGQEMCTAYVFFSRIQQQAELGELSLELVLGHAMAHELGHLLMGSNSHAGHGLMQSRWGPEQMRKATKGELQFTPDQARLIRMQVLKIARPI
jgi:hypothetical protein